MNMFSMYLVLLSIVVYFSSAALNTIEDLKEFFRETYLRKETGDYSLTNKKTSYATGFNPTWGFYRFHHVCLRGGSDGVFVGMDGVKSVALPQDNGLSPGEWNDLIGSRFNDPLTAFVLENKPDTPLLINPAFFPNSTLFTNCNRQHSFAFNPSTFLMKLGFMYELASCLQANLGRHKVFKKDLALPFKQIFMHQCPNPDSSRWEWGKSTWHVIEKKLHEAMLFQDSHTNILRRGNEATADELLCFEDLYLSARTGHWLQGSENLISFRRETAIVTGEPKEAKLILERPLTASEQGLAGVRIYQNYCNRNVTVKSEKEQLADRLAGIDPEIIGPLTNARIKIFQRTETNSPRSFLNLEEVKAFVQQYSTVPVEVISTTEKHSIQEQIRLFNSFDILLTVHGSHLSNGIYTMHPSNKAVIEIAPFLFDPVYFKNYNGDLGFAEYIVSTGHLAPKASTTNSTLKAFCAFSSFADFEARDCTLQHKSNGPRLAQDWITCSPNFHSRGCDVYVNTTILKTHMDMLIKKGLCGADAKLANDIASLNGKGNSPITSTSAQFAEYTSTSSSSVPVAPVVSKDELKDKLLGQGPVFSVGPPVVPQAAVPAPPDVLQVAAPPPSVPQSAVVQGAIPQVAAPLAVVQADVIPQVAQTIVPILASRPSQLRH